MNNDNMNKGRRLLLAELSEHEREHHDGEPCGKNRASAAAWILHSLGIGTPNLHRLLPLIANYERDCPCGVVALPPEAFEREH